MANELYFHGVTKGQDIWGPDVDREYIKSFYTGGTEEKVRFVVEISPKKNKAFYTYLRAKNFYSAENREGSYFGMTLSLDGQYCRDNDNLFKLFDEIYTKCVANNTLVSQSGEKEKYVVTSFAEKKADIEKIQKLFLDTIAKSFVSDLANIDSNFSKEPSGQVLRFNIYEVDSQIFFSALYKHLRLYMSPEYPTKDALINALSKQVEPEKVKAQNLSSELEDLKSKYKTLSANYDSLKMESSKVKEDLQKQCAEVSKLKTSLQVAESEKKRVSSELEANRSKKSIESSVAKLEAPLDELLKAIRKIVPSARNYSGYSNDVDHHGHQHHEPTSDDEGFGLKGWLSGLTLFFVLCLLCLNIATSLNWINFDSSTVSSNDYAELKIENQSLRSQVGTLSQQLAAAQKTLAEVQTIQAQTATSSTSSSETQASAVSVTIDLSPYDGKSDLVVGTEYTATAKNLASSESHIEWKVDGFEIVRGTKTDRKITITPVAGKKEAVISFYIGKDKVSTRKLKVK